MPACPLTLSWVSGQPKTHDNTNVTVEREKEGRVGENVTAGGGSKEGDMEDVGNGRRQEEGGGGGGGVNNLDYESIVLMKLRQAEERKRLCNELAANVDS